MIHHLLIFWQRKLEDSYHENLRLQTKLEESDRINRELLALSNRQASTIRSLTKAGNEMAADLIGEFGSYNSVNDWNAAKEDTQS
jgi:hypothetical protein